MTKRNLPATFNEPDLKFIDDVQQYWQYQQEVEEVAKKMFPLSDCCNANVTQIEIPDGIVDICIQCHGKCKIV
jgi:hypothetical protein